MSRSAEDIKAEISAVQFSKFKADSEHVHAVHLERTTRAELDRLKDRLLALKTEFEGLNKTK